jgi:hypothetical protein
VSRDDITPAGFLAAAAAEFAADGAPAAPTGNEPMKPDEPGEGRFPDMWPEDDLADGEQEILAVGGLLRLPPETFEDVRRRVRRFRRTVVSLLAQLDGLRSVADAVRGGPWEPRPDEKLEVGALGALWAAAAAVTTAEGGRPEDLADTMHRIVEAAAKPGALRRALQAWRAALRAGYRERLEELDHRDPTDWSRRRLAAMAERMRLAGLPVPTPPRRR